ncbi:pilus-assembly fibrillin subunit [Escherichia coli]|uniref:pilus-assembly fibrillin subunit n=1 Tax=Escherichia coli TaxID=562 RepID=UPI00240CF468|nr:pilus-assembly fibrillin subunit [Escherichia coli]WEY65517.1 pilus-assembly fibrillin subunit [Escherichia coli]
MNRAAAGFYLAVVLGSCSMNGVSQADELLTRDDFFVADESRHQWVNEHNGRTGALNVKGALVSSPCQLDTNEVQISERKKRRDIQKVKVNMSGCGYGNVPESFSEWNRKLYVNASITMSGLLRSACYLPSKRKFLSDGENQLIFYLECGMHIRSPEKADREANALIRMSYD